MPAYQKLTLRRLRAPPPKSDRQGLGDREGFSRQGEGHTCGELKRTGSGMA